MKRIALLLLGVLLLAGCSGSTDISGHYIISRMESPGLEPINPDGCWFEIDVPKQVVRVRFYTQTFTYTDLKPFPDGAVEKKEDMTIYKFTVKDTHGEGYLGCLFAEYKDGTYVLSIVGNQATKFQSIKKLAFPE